ncbi:MAG: DUF4332 domain-containing protein [Spirochaetes bacterium]|nr:DUF4332 domain-containing protein [Spirochaetota bacterium]
MANYKISDIEGIGAANAKKLAKAKIKSVNALLKKGCTKAGRKQISQESGIEDSTILKWVNMADLYRIKGIGSEYSELLEKAGVDTVKELKNRTPENLYKKLEEVNKKSKLVRQLPGEKIVKKWVDEAKKLSPMVTY